MITGSLDTLQRTPLPAPLARIMVEVVKSLAHWREAPLGKQDIDGLKLFCLVSETLTEPVADRRGEFHEQYLDIQLLLRGGGVDRRRAPCLCERGCRSSPPRSLVRR